MNTISILKSTLSCLALALLVPSLAMAGNLEPTAPPSDPASAVYTTEDIYHRLHSGAPGTKRPDVFTEPSAVPSDGVGKTLNQIMEAAPIPDNSTGLKPSEAPAGKTFWGLNEAAGGWGRQTGTNANVIDTSEATAPAGADAISLGKKAFVNGKAVIGSRPAPGPIYACTGTMNGSRWCDNGNGTVRDMTTGLVWLQNANCWGAQTWDEAERVSTVLKSGWCGLTDGSVAGDWHLPTKNELASLHSGVENVYFFMPRNFSDVQGRYYWSATTKAGSSVWCIHFYSLGVNYGTKASAFYVWPVRSGQ